MKNIALKSFLVLALFSVSLSGMAESTASGKTPTATLDINDAAGSSAYYVLDAVPNIKNLDWVGYNNTGSGSGGCISASHWKLSSSRTITFKVKNCSKVEAVDSYFSKDATENLKYSINGGTAVSFATNGTLKKTCASGSFETNNSGEITIVLSADNDVALNELRFYSAKSSTPTVAVTGVTLDKASLSLEEGEEATLTATVAPSDATNKAVTWSSNKESIATVDQNGKVTAIAEGTATITVTTTDGNKTATCAVTVKKSTTVRPVESIALSPTTLSLKEGGTSTLTLTFTPSNATNKAVTWKSSNTAVAAVSNSGTVTAVAEGSATITVTSDDGGKTATCAVTVTAATPVPATDLKIHEPEVYEERQGYNTPLTVFNNREYEVYYPGKTTAGDASVCVTPNTQKQDGITNNSSTTATAKDGWFVADITSISNYNMSAQDEFAAGSSNVMHKMANDKSYKLHIKGFDQFSFIAKDKKQDTSSKQDKPDNNQLFEVYIDGNLQPAQTNTSSATIRRYDITPKEHLIEVRAVKNGNSEFYGFSLRVSQTPRVRHLQGNDSTQNVLVSQTIKDVIYRVKYNEDTRLIWDGAEATGITLTKGGSLGVADTMIVGGTPICDAGDYTYRVATYQNGIEMSSQKGKLHVSTRLDAISDLSAEGFVGEDIDEFQFRFYAKDASAVSVKWNDKTPAGITTSSKDKTFIIGGVPTTAGTYPFTVSIQGGNSIDGTLTVISEELGNNPVLYLYKKGDYKSDIVYKTLQSKGFAPAPRKAKNSGMRTMDQLSKFNLIVISEDVDAVSEEVLAIIRSTELTIPVLNMKSFTYSASRLGWGAPNNGVNTNTKITVMQPTHPIFKGLNATQNGALDILEAPKDSLTKGIMPSEINQPHGSVCLAIAPKNGIEYMSEGDPAVAIHEIPLEQRSGKYILFPIGGNATLNQTGTRLLQNIVDYLTDADAKSVTLPELRINSFSINGINATIDEDGSLITLNLPAGTDVTVLKPEITVADKAVILTPANGEVQDFSDNHFGVTYTLSDYINRRSYQVIVSAEGTGLETSAQEGVWFDGNTLHNPNSVPLYLVDVMGRILTYSNSDIDLTPYARGIYLVAGSNFTLKILK